MSTDTQFHPITGLQFTSVSDIPRIEGELSTDSRRLASLLDLAKDLNGLVHVEEILTRIGHTVFDMLRQASHISVAVRSAKGFEPAFGICRSGHLDRDSIWVSDTMVSLVNMSQMALLFDPRDVEGRTAQTMNDHRSGSSMSLPLNGANGLIGVMQVDNRDTQHAFDKKDLDLAILLGNHAASALERAQLQRDIEKMFSGFVEASVTAIEARDPTTSGHSRRVAAFAIALADAVGNVETGPLESWSFSEPELRELAYASLLHDFGKVAVSEKILVKANRLFPEDMRQVRDRFALIAAIQQIRLWQDIMASGDTSQAHAWVAKRAAHFRHRLDHAFERINKIDAAGYVNDEDAAWIGEFGELNWTDLDGRAQPTLTESEIESLSVRRGTLTVGQRAEIERHVQYSHRVLMAIPWSEPLANVPQFVEAHHEKIDGTGYPLGLAGDMIPRQARLMSVVDIFDALTASDRPYRTALPATRGLDILRMEAKDGKIDSRLVEVFVESKIWERPAPIDWMRQLAFGATPSPSIQQGHNCENHANCPGALVCAK